MGIVWFFVWLIVGIIVLVILLSYCFLCWRVGGVEKILYEIKEEVDWLVEVHNRLIVERNDSDGKEHLSSLPKENA